MIETIKFQCNVQVRQVGDSAYHVVFMGCVIGSTIKQENGWIGQDVRNAWFSQPNDTQRDAVVALLNRLLLKNA